jgi:hypothetical protein
VASWNGARTRLDAGLKLDNPAVALRTADKQTWTPDFGTHAPLARNYSPHSSQPQVILPSRFATISRQPQPGNDAGVITSRSHCQVERGVCRCGRNNLRACRWFSSARLASSITSRRRAIRSGPNAPRCSKPWRRYSGSRVERCSEPRSGTDDDLARLPILATNARPPSREPAPFGGSADTTQETVENSGR